MNLQDKSFKVTVHQLYHLLELHTISSLVAAYKLINSTLNKQTN